MNFTIKDTVPQLFRVSLQPFFLGGWGEQMNLLTLDLKGKLFRVLPSWNVSFYSRRMSSLLFEPKSLNKLIGWCKVIS